MYQQHWESALGRLVEGATKSALITSDADPTVAKYIFWWPLYRDGDTVYVQNQMLHYDQLPRPFSILDPWKSIHERRTVTPDGRQISDWKTDIRNISLALVKIKERVAHP